MRVKKHRTTILIDCDRVPHDDLQYINAKGFKPTNLLRAKIKELKNKDLYGEVNYKEANERLHNRLTKLCEVLEQVLSKEHFNSIMQKI